jgi:hypothetical protein
MKKPDIFLIFIIVGISFIAGCGYLQVNPPPDVSLEEDSRNNTNWQAAAANMLASAGYGEGQNIQERADNIYTQINDYFGNNTPGWADAALEWWLKSEHNLWKDNPYQLVGYHGNKADFEPWHDPEGSIKLGSMAREGHLLAIDISWPPSEYQSQPSGHHVLNYIGDSQKKKRISTEPGHIRVADVYRNNGGSIQTYEYDEYEYPNPAGKNAGKGWYFNYDENHPFIRAFTTLSPVSTPESSGLCHSTVTSYKVKQPIAENASRFHFTALCDSSFAGYSVQIDRMTRRDPRIIEEVSNDRSITFDWNISHRNSSNGEWLTVSTLLYQATLHQMSYRDIWFAYRGDDTLIAAPNICWNLTFHELDDVRIPNISGGYVIGSISVAGADSLNINQTSELRFITRYNLYESPLYHTLNVCCNEAFVATEIKLGHSYSQMDPESLWAFEDWITTHQGEMDLSDTLSFKQYWSKHIKYPKAGNYFGRVAEF